MATQPNPLLGSWPSTAGINMPGSVPGGPGAPQLPAAPTGTPGTTNPYGQGSRGGGDLGFNLAETNLQTGVYKNALLPLFSATMFQHGGDAGKFFKMLTDLGSPFYQRKQQQTAEQGAKAGQDAAGRSRQQLQAAGAGYTPSGAGAAMFGGEAQAEAGNQEEAFLNNLFQNEQLQLAGASGLTQLASLFSPAQLTGQSTPTSIQQPTNTAAEMMNAVGSLTSGIFGSKGIPTGGG